MESSSGNNQNFQANEEYFRDLLEFGFGEEEVLFALKITNNNKEQAAELLCSGGANLETLQALAQIATFTAATVNQMNSGTEISNQQQQQMPFGVGHVVDVNKYSQPFQGNQGMDTKMVIAFRNDMEFAKMPIGQSSKLVSEAVIYAYQKGQEQCPHLVMQWEMNSWPKIALKCKDEEELLKIEENAQAKGINHFLLKKKMKNGGTQLKTEEECKNQSDETKQCEPKIQESISDEKEISILCVVGPDFSEKINSVTGHLKLL